MGDCSTELHQVGPLVKIDRMTSTTLHKARIIEYFQDDAAVNLPLIPYQRCAAVAMIFHERADGLVLCFEKRAQFEGDPWSGDMSFPGGKADPPDKTFHDTARRETFEEIGLELKRTDLIGALPLLETFGSEERPSLAIQPLIYIKRSDPAPFTVSYEVDTAFWIPTGHLWQPGNWVEEHFVWNGRVFPGIRYRKNVIWGLTLRILNSFAQRLDLPLPMAPA